MKRHFSLRKICVCAVQELRTLLLSERSIFVVFSLIIVYETVLSPLASASEQSGLTLSPAEPFLIILLHPVSQMVIPLLYLLLFAEFPSAESRLPARMVRISKRTWIISELLSALVAILLYLCALCIFSVIILHSSISFSDGWTQQWSRFLLELRSAAPELYESSRHFLLPPEATTHGTPFTVFLVSFTLQIMLASLHAAALLAADIFGKKTAVLAVLLGADGAGFALMNLHSRLKWLFPTVHSCFSLHFRGAFAEPEMKLKQSYWYFAAIILAILLTALLNRQVMPTQTTEKG